jgi:hypothetical protein
MTNTNYLDGVRCPRCGNADTFFIDTQVTLCVTDGGAELHGDTEWTADSRCHRPGCDTVGVVRAFRGRSPLPPDPEGMNGSRAEWAGYALAAFRSQTGCDREDALADLLGDLTHWCDRSGVSFADELDRAEWHDRTETSEGGV